MATTARRPCVTWAARPSSALVVPDAQVAYQILALNTEKAHNLKEKCLEVIRMARSLADLDDRSEGDYAFEFEEPVYLTLGCCYEQRARFSGSVYSSAIKGCEAFFSEPLHETLAVREQRGQQLLDLDEAVGEAVKRLKDRGFDSPYLKAFVVARINPYRFKKDAKDVDFDTLVGKMTEQARGFDAEKVKPEQVARAAGAA